MYLKYWLKTNVIHPIRITIILPSAIIKDYNLKQYAVDGYAYMQRSTKLGTA